jgi:DNA-binding response OmpR family regulator
MFLDTVYDRSAPLRFARPRAGLRRAPSVFVADDDMDVRELLSTRLVLAGFEVATASDGPSAMAAMHRHRPDVAVLDVVMPGISGYEICLRMREMSSVPPPPVILLTGKSAPESVRAGLAAGATFYHIKPVDFQRLLQQIRSLLDGHDPIGP